MTSFTPITPRTETVSVLQGDDDDRLAQLQADVERLRPKKGQPPQSLDEAGDYATALEDLETFAAEAEERGVKVVLRALGRKAWRDLIAKHPVREGNEGDKSFGANIDSLQDELVGLCLASPVGSDAERDAFLDSLNEGQFGDLAIRAWRLNMQKTADPKALRSFVRDQRSAETSD